MYKEPMFLEPVMMERIWGGTKLQDLFNYTIPSSQTGEAWVIAAHPNGSSTINNGPFKGKRLIDIWEKHPSLFGKKVSDNLFPLLVKIIDANDYLSVQVHPNDEYARKVVGEPYGKTECWYVLHCEEDAEIIFGHHSLTKEQFLTMVEENAWDRLLKKQRVTKGDFIYVPCGTIHAIGKGIVLLEIQQNSDTTYRIYDYGRKDEKGQQRDLHIDSAMEVITFHHEDKSTNRVISTIVDVQMSQLSQSTYFTNYYWELNGICTTILVEDYLLVTVIHGTGELVVDGLSYSLN